MKRLQTGAILALGILAGIGNANALVIDFTHRTWQGTLDSDTLSSKTRTFGGIDVTVTAFNGDGLAELTFTRFDGSDAAPCGTLLACDADGAGIDDDEITFGIGGKSQVERLVVEFSRALDLARFHFFDLAAAEPDGEPVSERAQWQVNGSGPGGFLDAYDTGGYGVTAFLGYEGVTMVEFFADTALTSSPANTDFAVAAIATVPEPGTLALMGLGLAGMGLARKRRRTA